jgi:hypothetical protein
MELQKKIEIKDKEILNQKEKNIKLAEKVQEKEDMLLEKDWLIVEMRQSFEEKLDEVEKVHCRERDDLAGKLRSLRNDEEPVRGKNRMIYTHTSIF